MHSVSDSEEAAGLEEGTHLLEHSDRVWQMHHNHVSVHDVELLVGEVGEEIASVALDKVDVGDATTGSEPSGILDVLGRDVESGDMALGYELGQVEGYGSWTTADIKNIEVGFQAWKKVRAAVRGGSRGKEVFALVER